MSYTTTVPHKSTAAESKSHIRAASLGLACMADDLINHCAPLPGTEILATLDQMELLLDLIRHGVRSRL
ncbi:Beta-apo-4'-carotenal oxygenase [Fusarium oxysporum f. sp. albedinis]|nr:Beta-apo-4'-carotenal oxygenase [Fusarium oxysporum f. sp. albedinis]